MEILSTDIFPDIANGTPAAGKTYGLKHLQNKINLSNFKDGIITALFRLSDGKTTIRIPLKPLPCNADRLTCRCVDEPFDPHYLSRFEFCGLLVQDGAGLLHVEAQLEEINPETVIFRLPETCRKIQPQWPKTFSAKRIDAQVLQNGICFEGNLQTFNAEVFHIKIDFDRPHAFRRIQASTQTTLMLTADQKSVYIAECSISGAHYTRERWILRLCPKPEKTNHLKPKILRSDRVTPTPPLEAVFIHPLTGKNITLHVFDLSSLGFSLIVDQSIDIFPVGIVLPDLELRFAGTRLVTCTAQVVYRRQTGKDAATLRCGLAIIDIDLSDHTRLQAVVLQTTDSHAYFNAQIDMDDLWDFFFEAGFIYPEKYAFMEAHKDQIKDTYRRLYLESSIARHFIYKEKGQILGHMSMLRFYENCWMIQHHAARTAVSSRAGFAVLAHISRFIKDAQMLSSLHLDHVFCFYRPDNRFPKKIFGGVSQFLNDKQVCSVDRFAYFHIHQGDTGSTTPLTVPWQLKVAEPVDYLDLENSYARKSGGLMIRAFDLRADKGDVASLSALYTTNGFHRKRKIYALKRGDDLAAIIELNMADMGLNMSDLTNCIKVIAVKEKMLTPEVLKRVLATLAFCFYETDTVPVLFFPENPHGGLHFGVEKQYDLWIMDTEFSDHFIEYLSKSFRSRSGFSGSDPSLTN